MDRSFLPDGTKGDILYVALKVIVDLPPYQFTIAEIARQADTSKPKITYHYKNTDQIIIALMKAWALSGQTITQEYLQREIGGSPQDLIESIADATFQWIEKCPYFAGLTPLLIQMAQTIPEVGEMQIQTMSLGQNRIKDLLSHIRELKMTPNELNNLAQGLHLIVVGGALYFLGINKKGKKRLLENMKSNIRALIHASLQ